MVSNFGRVWNCPVSTLSVIAHRRAATEQCERAVQNLTRLRALRSNVVRSRGPQGIWLGRGVDQYCNAPLSFLGTPCTPDPVLKNQKPQ